MSRYAAAYSKTTGAAAGPMADIRTATAKDVRVWEIGCFAETAVSGTIGLVRSTGAGTTPGGDNVATAEDISNTRTVATHVYSTYGTEPTQASVYLRRAVLPATIGAGIIWAFPEGITVPTSTDTATGNGLMLRQLSSAAVTYSIYVVFEE
jgi:hypothetical protein